jgi:hypothetical protein
MTSIEPPASRRSGAVSLGSAIDVRAKFGYRCNGAVTTERAPSAGGAHGPDTQVTQPDGEEATK